MKPDYLQHNWRWRLAIAAIPICLAGIMLSWDLSRNGRGGAADAVFFLSLLLACLLSVAWFFQLASRRNPPLAASSILPSSDWHPRQCIADLELVVRSRKRAIWGFGLLVAVMLLHEFAPVITGSLERLPYVVDGRIVASWLLLKIAGMIPMMFLFAWAAFRYDSFFRLHYRWRARRHDAFRDGEVVAEAQRLYDELRLASPLPLRPRALV